MSTIETLERRRSWTLIAMALTFCLFQGSAGLKSVLGSDTAPLWVYILSALSALSWVGACLGFLVFAGQVAKHKASLTMDDELDRHLRGKAFTLGFGIAILTLAVIVQIPDIGQTLAQALDLGLTPWLSQDMLARLGLTLTVVIPTFYYVALSHPQAEG